MRWSGSRACARCLYYHSQPELQVIGGNDQENGAHAPLNWGYPQIGYPQRYAPAGSVPLMPRPHAPGQPGSSRRPGPRIRIQRAGAPSRRRTPSGSPRRRWWRWPCTHGQEDANSACCHASTTPERPALGGSSRGASPSPQTAPCAGQWPRARTSRARAGSPSGRPDRVRPRAWPAPTGVQTSTDQPLH